MSNFFRKDLNLGKKRWHKLAIFLFFIVFLCSIFFTLRMLFLNEVVYEKAEHLSTRITTELKSIKELKKPGENFGRTGRFHFDNNLIDNVYCSNEIYKYIETIMNQNKIYDIIANTLNDKELVGNKNGKPSLMQISNYLKNNNIYCISTENGFLEFRKDYQEDYAFYKKAYPIQFESTGEFTFKATIFSLINCLVFFIIAIVYYKVILHMIFDHKKH